MLTDAPYGITPRSTLPTSRVARCALCAGTYRAGPLAGMPFPPCLSCRDAIAREGVLYVARPGRVAVG